jgi:hypothetical protein
MTFTDAMTRVIIRAALYSLPLLLIVVSVHDTPARVIEWCLDNAGMPGYWDCDLGHRVDEWGSIGTGLDLPLR